MQLRKIDDKDNNLLNSLIDEGYNSLISKVLVNRGYDRELIDALLTTGYSEMPEYKNIKNVEVGADLIESHIAADSRIYIFGDYDSDGVNSAYILGDAISYAIYYMESNSHLEIKLPERSEGYGLNMNWCKSILKDEGKKLVITVDNGIAQKNEVAFLLENDVDVLITDHHQPNGNTPENVFIIDAHHHNEDENNKGLCGAGVAFKLAMTLLERLYTNDLIEEDLFNDLYRKYIIHVAIATITDSMPMTMDNISFVYNGLQLLKDGYGSDAINHYREYKKNTDLTPKDIAFDLGPQINACGRMNNTSLALNYLLAGEDEVEDLYNEVVNINQERKLKTEKALEITEELIDINKSAIIIELEDVEGIAGIIASNVSSKYNKCTIVFCRAGEVLVGSARSDGRVDLLKVLKTIANTTDIVVKVGGHAGACGITIKADKMNELDELLNSLLSSVPVIETKGTHDIEILVDDFITLSEVNKINCSYLYSLYFFTESNPVFAFNDVTITKVKYSGNNPNNIQFNLKDASGTLQTWAWGVGNMYKELGEPKQVTIIAELDMIFGKSPGLKVLNIIPKREIDK